MKQKMFEISCALEKVVLTQLTPHSRVQASSPLCPSPAVYPMTRNKRLPKRVLQLQQEKSPRMLQRIVRPSRKRKQEERDETIMNIDIDNDKEEMSHFGKDRKQKKQHVKKSLLHRGSTIDGMTSTSKCGRSRFSNPRLE